MRRPLFTLSIMCWLAASMGCEGGEQRRRKRAELALRRPATQSALVLRALRAIRDKDPVSYVGLLATASEVRRACPERFVGKELSHSRTKWKRAIKRAQGGVKACRDLFDWGRSRRISQKGGLRQGKIPHCKEAVWRLSDIVLLYQVGKQRYQVVLRKPYERGNGVFGFYDGPRCKISSDPS